MVFEGCWDGSISAGVCYRLTAGQREGRFGATRPPPTQGLSQATSRALFRGSEHASGHTIEQTWPAKLVGDVAVATRTSR